MKKKLYFLVMVIFYSISWVKSLGGSQPDQRSMALGATTSQKINFQVK